MRSSSLLNLSHRAFTYFGNPTASIVVSYSKAEKDKDRWCLGEHVGSEKIKIKKIKIDKEEKIKIKR